MMLKHFGVFSIWPLQQNKTRKKRNNHHLVYTIHIDRFHFPRIQGGELFERVIEEDYTLTEKACTVFIRQICEGVDFLHSRDILHLGIVEFKRLI